MIQIKTDKEIDLLREGGKRLAELVRLVADRVKPGVTTLELDEFAQGYIARLGDVPAFLGYRPDGHAEAFPAALCMSVDDEVVHGIPNDIPLVEGSIVSIDCGIKHEGLFTDHAITVPVGRISQEAEELVASTSASLDLAIRAAQPGNTVGDIGYAVESYVGKRFGIVRELAGHGVGRSIHEDPFVPNYGKPGRGAELVPGMVIAIEPMLVIGWQRIATTDDGYTIVTHGGGLAAHFEHTVAITDAGPEILTK